ncbi:MAG: Lrp/AsnC family transcriptional regulator [Acidimicrobiales bacterium]
METPGIDDLDRVILDELRFDARISWRELGERVGLGATATADRVRRLVDAGVITRFTTVVDPAAIGIGLRAIVDLRLGGALTPDAFEAAIAHTPEVQSAFHVTGPFDYQLVLSCADVATLDRLLRGWKADGWVLESNTRLLMTEIDLAAARAGGTGPATRGAQSAR